MNTLRVEHCVSTICLLKLTKGAIIPFLSLSLLLSGIPLLTWSAIFKPRFGGINFSFNKCRAAIVGPLTFFLWICWSFSRRSSNFLKSFQQSHQDHQVEKVVQQGRQQIQQQCPPPPPMLTKSSESNILVSSSTSKATSTPLRVHRHVHHHQHQQQQLELIHAPSSTSTSQLVWKQENGTGSRTRSRVYEQGSKSSSGSSGGSSGGSRRKGTAPHPSPSSVCSQEGGKHLHEGRTCTSSFASVGTAGVGGDMGVAGSVAATLTATSKRRKRKRRQRRKERRNKEKSGCTDDASATGSFHPLDSLHWTSIDLPRIYRIKQITRSCLNDVILAAISGRKNL